MPWIGRQYNGRNTFIIRNYLHRGDRSLSCGCDSLLHGTHISSQSRLVAHSWGDSTQQGGYLEEKIKIFCICQGCFFYTQSHTTHLCFPCPLFRKILLFCFDWQIGLKLTSDPACVKRKMLSMKSSTSWPSWSLKYSATVKPVKATLARAPGGSFICP